MHVRPPATWPDAELGVRFGNFRYAAFEIYANGRALGRAGRFPPDGRQALETGDTVVRLPKDAVGDDGRVVLAIRVWRHPQIRVIDDGLHLPADRFEIGLHELLLAESESVRARMDSTLVRRGDIFVGATLFTIAILHLLLWWRRRYAAYAWLALLCASDGLGLTAFGHLETLAERFGMINTYTFIFFMANAITFFALGRYAAWVLSPERPLKSWGARVVLVANGVAFVGLGLITLDLLIPMFTMYLSILVTSVWVLVRLLRRAFQRDDRVYPMLVGILLYGLGHVLGIFLPMFFEVGRETLQYLSWPVQIGVVVGSALTLARTHERMVDDLEATLTASLRFVPKDFLAQLGKTRVTDVALGDAGAQTMTVLFADVRGFSARIEQLTPAEGLAWLNRYFELVEPEIRNEGGFINQFYGDGILALFADASAALRAARAMARRVDESEGLAIGIGLHTGPLVLGTVGTEARLDTGVVGDAVNTAARIEGLTKTYGHTVLFSEETKQAAGIEDAERVDEVQPRGHAKHIELFTFG